MKTVLPLPAPVLFLIGLWIVVDAAIKYTQSFITYVADCLQNIPACIGGP